MLGFWPTFIIIAKVSSWKDESGVDGNYSGRKKSSDQSQSISKVISEEIRGGKKKKNK